MTLKNKLAKLKGLHEKENSLKREIETLKAKYSTTYKKYDYQDLKKKYLNMDFSNINPKNLRDIMIEDFENSNMTMIEKKEMYDHNMNMLASILSNVKQHEHHFNSIDDAKLAFSKNNNYNDNYDNNYNDTETKRINIKDGLNDFIAQYDSDDSDLDDSTQSLRH